AVRTKRLKSVYKSLGDSQGPDSAGPCGSIWMVGLVVGIPAELVGAGERTTCYRRQDGRSHNEDAVEKLRFIFHA
ncbi:hypothetical protein, partial [Stenotrophomonas sp.]|uniref:hypothetical protein n=1 Tax=Stenotrophomonas sp. TaxID=69392 RepID=UPI0028AED717